MNHYTRQGTPNHHVASAHAGHMATASVSRRGDLPIDFLREKQKKAFREGLLVGFCGAVLIFAALLWLWVIPTMDGAVGAAMGALS